MNANAPELILLPHDAAPASPPEAGDALDDLLAEVERLDALLQLQLLEAQRNSDDRQKMAEVVLSPQQLEELTIRPQGRPAWARAAGADAQASAGWRASPLGRSAGAAHSRLGLLAERFGLSGAERDLLLLAALPLLDSRYGVIFSYLQNDPQKQWPSQDLAVRLLAEDPLERLRLRASLSAASPLLGHALAHVVTAKRGAAEHAAGRALRVDDDIFAYLLGQDGLPVDLSDCARWMRPCAGAEHEVRWSGQLARTLRPPKAGVASPVVLVRGFEGGGRSAAVARAARIAGVQALELRLDLLPAEDFDAWQVLRQALREVRLRQAWLVMRGVADMAERRKALFARWSARLSEERLPAVCLCDPTDAIVWFGQRPQLALELPPRSVKADRALLQEHLAALDAEPDIDLDGLVRRFHLSADSLPDILAEADLHRAARKADGPLAECDLYAAFRLRAQQNFGKLAQRVEPRRGFDDLIVSDVVRAQLHEILAAIRHREHVLEQGFGRKLAYGFGISALFHGDSGTGKTMVAEVLAGELGVDLIKVDLSTVVNKYIGETEKNLARIFDLAAADAGVLFFDEADALFGKRSETKDAQDRHANIEVSYLLQRLESYPGLVILSTNNRNHLDNAFSRRITFMTRFGFPDAALRERMWRAIWPREVQLDGDIDYPGLARKAEITGANIRNTALLATWLAREEGAAVGQRHVELALKRELSKIGRIAV